jgi:membrane protease YdiL (CAAX protease family)
LGGLRRKLSTTQLVLVVGLIFGLYHISSEKIPIVSLMGMLLVFICLRADSIFPAMLVHAVHNGLALAATRIEGLRSFYGLPDASVETIAIQFDERAAAFLFVFLVGLALMATSRGGGGASSATGSGSSSPDPLSQHSRSE